ncbi:MAG: hypothetical protein NT075_28715 [Chloroflexi bacterium]|nr:hypothetical protein [Chloroflexota bacterium]
MAIWRQADCKAAPLPISPQAPFLAIMKVLAVRKVGFWDGFTPARCSALLASGIQTREQVIQYSSHDIFKDMVEVERIFLIVKAQQEYG